MTNIEPWLRGPLAGVDPHLAPILYCFQQAREDLNRWTQSLTDEQLWARPGGIGAAGFHIRHIGGSVNRLMTYVIGNEITEQQLGELKAEQEPGETLQDLLTIMRKRLEEGEAIVRSVDPATWNHPREVGRKRLPSTVGGLLTHIAEHVQRHIGQAITTIKVVRAFAAPERSQAPLSEI